MVRHFSAWFPWRVCIFAQLVVRTAAQASPSPAPTSYPSDERALRAIYASSGGSSAWASNTNWMLGDPCTASWYGVNCTVNGQVKQLQLLSIGLTGTLPSEMGLLTAIVDRTLLGRNSLTSSIPTQLGLLTGIKYGCILRKNKFSGPIPTELGRITKMENVILNDNYLSGSLPSELAVLTSLTKLSVTSNNLCGSIPSEVLAVSSSMTTVSITTSNYMGPTSCSQTSALIALYNAASGAAWASNANWLNADPCTNSWTGVSCSSSFVTQLSFKSTSFVGSLPTDLGALTAMNSKLIISFMDDLTGTIPTQMGLWTALAGLFAMRDNSLLGGTLPTELGNLITRTNFFVDQNGVTGSIPSEIGRLATLTSNVQIYDASLTGSLPTQLGGLSGLTGYFYAQSSGYSGSIPSELGRWTGLITSINMAANSFTGVLPTELGRMEALSGGFRFFSNQLCDALPSELWSMSSDLTSFSVTNTDIGTPCCLISSSSATCSPTQVPTPVPTALPTKEPSPVPTPVPTLVPTDVCQPGYARTSTGCTKCAAGKYLNDTEPPFGTSCLTCPAGKRAKSAGAPYCDDCASGKFSSVDRTECSECPAGTFVLNASACEDCSVGKYAPSAQTGDCLDCLSGFYTGQPLAATACEGCPAGTYSGGDSANCSLCPAGQYSSGRSSSCTNCSKGYFSATSTASVCTACEAGTITDKVGQTNCTNCARGRYQSATGQSQCITCGPGYYNDQERQISCTKCGTGYATPSDGSIYCTACYPGRYEPTSGSTSCMNCSAGYWSNYSGASSCEKCDTGRMSNQGSTSCKFCDIGYYMDLNDECQYCDTQFYSCDSPGSALAELYLKQGYWRITEVSIDFRACRPGACGGGVGGQCNEGYQGVLCAVCDDRYYLDSGSGRCKSCDEAGDVSSPANLSILVVVMLIVIAGVYAATHRTPQTEKLSRVTEGQGLLSSISLAFKHKMAKFPKRKLESKFKIIVTFLQLVCSVGFNLSVEFPLDYERIVDQIFGLVSFDFLATVPFDCIDDDVISDYRLTLFTKTMLPITLALILLFLHWMKRKQTNTWLVGFLILSHLVLPSVSSTIFLVFKCDAFPDTQQSFLVSDYSITCDLSGAIYRSLVAFALPMVFVFPIGIPCMFAVLLFRSRHELYPRLAKEGVKSMFFKQPSWDNQDEEDSTPASHTLSFICQAYEPHVFWFEVAECYRRLLLSSMLVLFGDGSVSQIVVALCICLASIRIYAYYAPFVDDSDDNLAETGQWAVFFVLFCALLLRVDVSGDDPESQNRLTVILMVLTLSPVIFMVLLAALEIYSAGREALEANDDDDKSDVELQEIFPEKMELEEISTDSKIWPGTLGEDVAEAEKQHQNPLALSVGRHHHHHLVLTEEGHFNRDHIQSLEGYHDL